MYDFTLYDISDLFRVRDALVTLAGYGLANRDMLADVIKEIMGRKEEIPDYQNPDKERDIPEK